MCVLIEVYIGNRPWPTAITMTSQNDVQLVRSCSFFILITGWYGVYGIEFSYMAQNIGNHDLACISCINESTKVQYKGFINRSKRMKDKWCMKESTNMQYKGVLMVQREMKDKGVLTGQRR